MKKLLFIILLTIPFLGFGQKKLLVDELTLKGKVMFYQGTPFDGISFDIYKNGKLKFESNYTKGVKDGVLKKYYTNGK